MRGCIGVYLGIESGDQRILKLMEKFADVRRYREAIRKLRERDILTFASFIVGYGRRRVEFEADETEMAAIFAGWQPPKRSGITATAARKKIEYFSPHMICFTVS